MQQWHAMVWPQPLQQLVRCCVGMRGRHIRAEPSCAFLAQESDLIRLKRVAKLEKGFFVEPEAKLAFVVRIRGLNKIHPKVRGGDQTALMRGAHSRMRATVRLLTVCNAPTADVLYRPRRSCSCSACARSTWGSL